MQRKLLLAIIPILLAACGSTTSTPIPAAATVTGSPVVSATDTTIPFATATVIPLPTPPGAPHVASPALVRIAFQDVHNGWGIDANDGGSILRTADGGASWVNVTPPGLTGLGYSTNLSVLNVNTVWVLVPNADFFTGKLYRTTDGGLTWNSFPAPFGGGSMQFLDAGTGRVLADRGAAAGSQAVELFQTGDGGETWLSVFHNDPGQVDSASSLPFSGNKNGMTFLDANDGWVTGTRPVEGDVYLFVTHDGGITWAQQSITLPSSYETYQYMPQAPVFFGNDGFLPLMIYLKNSVDLTFNTTQDGGNTWTSDPNNASKVITPGQYAFADPLHAWSWDGGGNIYFTTDGTQSWSTLSVSLNLSGRLAQMVFVPAPSGQFTGWALTGVDDKGATQLYRTTDNCSTWTPLIP